MSLEEYRKEIDRLDEELLRVLARRHDVLRKIGDYKKEKGLPVLDPERKRQVLDAFEANARRLGLDVEFAQNLYELIHVYALKTEEEGSTGLLTCVQNTHCTGQKTCATL